QLGPQHLDLALRLRQLLLQIVNLSLEALRPVLPALLPTSLTLGIGQGHVLNPPRYITERYITNTGARSSRRPFSRGLCRSSRVITHVRAEIAPSLSPLGPAHTMSTLRLPHSARKRALLWRLRISSLALFIGAIGMAAALSAVRAPDVRQFQW